MDTLVSTLQIKVPKVYHEAIKAAAKAAHRTVPAHVRAILEETIPMPAPERPKAPPSAYRRPGGE